MNYLYFDTPQNEFQNYYGNVDRPFTTNVQTQLPPLVAIIRAVALLAFSAILLVLKSASAWAWAVAVAGVATAAWTIYTHIIRKDPLVEAFYQMLGGEEEYEKLPEFDTGGKAYFHADMIHHVNWDKLTDPVLRATTKDGRNVLIVKCLSRDLKQTSIAQAHMEMATAFIEKYGPEDMHEATSPATVKLRTGLLALYSFSFILNHTSSGSSGGIVQKIEETKEASCISAEMANEFYAQM